MIGNGDVSTYDASNAMDKRVLHVLASSGNPIRFIAESSGKVVVVMVVRCPQSVSTNGYPALTRFIGDSLGRTMICSNVPVATVNAGTKS